MKFIRQLQRWIDRDWEKRGYNPMFAYAQKIMYLSPLLLVGAADLVIGIPPGSSAYYWSGGIALTLGLIIYGWQLYRWLVGYVRPSWHEEQTRKRRERKKHS